MVDVGSATKDGPDWWMASDRRWYPPELHPSAQKPSPARPAAGNPASAGQPKAAQAAQAARAAHAAQPGSGNRTQVQGRPQAGSSAPGQNLAYAQSVSQAPRSSQVNAPMSMDLEDSGSPNRLAGMVGLVGAVLTILGSFLTWAVDNGKALAGFESADASFSGFQSNGELVLLFGVVALVAAGLLLAGTRPGWAWGIVSLLAGAGVIAVLFFSYLDITGSASADWSNQVGDASELGRAAADTAGIGLRTALGFWVTGAGALVLAVVPPFLRRD